MENNDNLPEEMDTEEGESLENNQSQNRPSSSDIDWGRIINHLMLNINSSQHSDDDDEALIFLNTDENGDVGGISISANNSLIRPSNSLSQGDSIANLSTLISERMQQINDDEKILKIVESSQSMLPVKEQSFCPTNLNSIKDCITNCQANNDFKSLLRLIELVFGSFDSIAFSFMSDHVKLNSDPQQISESSTNNAQLTHLSDIKQVRLAYSAILYEAVPPEKSDIRNQIAQTLQFTLRKTITRNLRESVSDFNHQNEKEGTNKTLEKVALVNKETRDILTESTEQNKAYQINFTNISESIETMFNFELSNDSRKFLNVLLIAFECPLILDPLHFEILLPVLCLSVSWLSLPMQAFLTLNWARNAKISFKYGPIHDVNTRARDELLTEENCHIWALQRMLMQHITLRCLSLDDLISENSLPNDDKELQEVLSVLRIVFYASLLAGEHVDNIEELNLEKEENEKFNQLIIRYHTENGTLHAMSSKRQTRMPTSDPLGGFLGITAVDCRKPLIPPNEFINEILNIMIKPHEDIIKFIARLRTGLITTDESKRNSSDTLARLPQWIKVARSKSISFMEYPFILQTSTKNLHLYYDNRYRMYEARRFAIARAIFDETSENLYLKMMIKRESIVEDALTHLDLVCLENPSDLKKQLFVEFEGEQGIDEGGLTKEFFQLIVTKLFNADYAMFILDQETQTYWFNPSPLDDMEREYCLIGTILGLAIYNHVILDIRFPTVLYRKLLGKLGKFEDLEQDWPVLARGLKSMSEFEGSATEFEDTFSTNFEISFQDVFGCIQTQELIPGGSSMPVTMANRHSYINHYADFLLNKSIEKQFNAFRRGFHMVVADSPLPYLFRPDEIEMLVRGSDNYDFNQLEQVTTYGSDYSADHRVIKEFWSVVHEMNPEQKRDLLKFTTGSDRIPVGGMSKMKFSIIRHGPDSNYLPSAHTCFNILLLPEYSAREKLQTLLLKAITYSQGFAQKALYDIGLPDEVLDLQRLASARAIELIEFEKIVGSSVCTARAITALQKLPIRLRRRMASHHPNRLPRRFHHNHLLKQMGSSAPKVQKQIKACRRQRRRRSRLHALRTRSVFSIDLADAPETGLWLPTHLWHAKRFKMLTKWGYRLPLHSNEKTFKITQSATHKNCALIDISYLSCFQLNGNVKEILSKITNLDFNKVRPNQELECIVYNPLNEKFELTECLRKLFLTRRPIGPGLITFLSEDCVWLWVHPCISTRIKLLIQNLVLEIKDLQFHDRTGHFARFKLIGEQSHQILMDILRPEEEDQGVIPLQNSTEMQITDEKWKYLSSIASASAFPLGFTFEMKVSRGFKETRPQLKLHNRHWINESLTRLQTLSKAKSIQLTADDFTKKYPSSNLLSQPPSLEKWQDVDVSLVRIESLNTINKGFETHGTLDPSGYSIILIQNGSDTLAQHFSHVIGWDVVIPRLLEITTHNHSTEKHIVSTVAKDFLIACVYRGSIVMGQRDLKQWAFIGTQASTSWVTFPDSGWFDTEIGAKEEEEKMNIAKTTNEFKQKKFRDQNFIPFFNQNDHQFTVPWAQLIKQNVLDCTPLDFEIRIIRDEFLLKMVISRMLNASKSASDRSRLTRLHLHRYHPILLSSLFLALVHCTKRGYPKENSAIYATQRTCLMEELPDRTDLLTELQLIGFVIFGGFHMGLGSGFGVSLISLGALGKAYETNVGKEIIFRMQRPCSRKLHPVNLKVANSFSSKYSF